jgi:hypothetical protein
VALSPILPPRIPRQLIEPSHSITDYPLPPSLFTVDDTKGGDDDDIWFAFTWRQQKIDNLVINTVCKVMAADESVANVKRWSNRIL